MGDWYTRGGRCPLCGGADHGMSGCGYHFSAEARVAERLSDELVAAALVKYREWPVPARAQAPVSGRTMAAEFEEARAGWLELWLARQPLDWLLRKLQEPHGEENEDGNGGEHPL